MHSLRKRIVQEHEYMTDTSEDRNMKSSILSDYCRLIFGTTYTFNEMKLTSVPQLKRHKEA